MQARHQVHVHMRAVAQRMGTQRAFELEAFAVARRMSKVALIPGRAPGRPKPARIPARDRRMY